MLTSGTLTPSASSDRCTPVDAASTLSPSRMIANSPWRSAMWCGCQLVGRLRSAHSGTESSIDTSATNIASSASSESTPASANASRSSQPTSATVIPAT